jgi:hypothetical protein
MSMTFDEICELEEGDQFTEGSQYGDIHCTVIENPEITTTTVDGEERRQVRFTAESKEGREIDYLKTERSPYGPDLYEDWVDVYDHNIEEES